MRNDQMNERIEDLMYHAGLTASGCWDQMDDYDKRAIEKFAELIAADCISVVTNFSPNYPLRYKNNLLIEVNHRDQIEEIFRGNLVEGIKEHFGVEL